MPSSKRNSITAKAMGLIFALFNVASSRDVPFRQPLQLECLHHGFTKAHLCFPSCSIPFSSAYTPFLSPLPHRWRFAVRTLWLQCDTWASAVVAGALLTLFFAWNVSQKLKELEKKWYTLLKWHTHFYINSWGVRSDDQAFHIFRNGWIDCWDAFHVVLCL